MREAWLIARREYLERIRSKAFRVSTVLIPLLFALIFGIGAFSAKLVGALGRGSTLPGAFDFDAVSKAVGFAAIPIESTTRVGAADPNVTTLKSVDRHDVDPQMFELPSGYAKRALGPKPTKSSTP